MIRPVIPVLAIATKAMGHAVAVSKHGREEMLRSVRVGGEIIFALGPRRRLPLRGFRSFARISLNYLSKSLETAVGPSD
jgi:hypothetical protein